MHKTVLSLIAFSLAVPAGAQQVAPTAPTSYQRAIAAGYKAATLCSAVFIAGRTPTAIDGEELRGIYPEYDGIVPTLSADIDRKLRTVDVSFDPALPPRTAFWDSRDGCVLSPIGAGSAASMEEEIKPDGTVVAPRIGPAAADPRRWPQGDAGIAPRPPAALAERVADAFGQTYGAGHTIGVVVLRDGEVVAERYGPGWGPLVANRTWSVAKSISGTLIGMAGLDPAKPAAVANWRGVGDPRGAITLDQLLRMASGLHGDTAGNRTDAIYFGGTAVDEQVPGLPLDAKPGSRFRYANNDILLAVSAMRATLSDARYGEFPKATLFAPLGMHHTVAERDWHGNYVLSSQVWSTARDLARLGQFWLQDGVWAGKRLLPAGWMTYMTTPSGPQPESGPGYGATLWLFGPKQGLPEGSYAAQGNRGQYVMVIPSRKLVIVRRGEDPGAARFDIAKFAADVAAAVK
ncbi:serine hydrolase domain-containing protein [Sphingomonas sp. PB4P5]|uniref:serine hydrolase domain-containing protein n=1 Tax=Parasphingomonas puruogangriensis TaxID=3096155 RepID=UPI002FC8357F